MYLVQFITTFFTEWKHANFFAEEQTLTEANKADTTSFPLLSYFFSW